jgi:hypothetical protein
MTDYSVHMRCQGVLLNGSRCTKRGWRHLDDARWLCRWHYDGYSQIGLEEFQPKVFPARPKP